MINKWKRFAMSVVAFSVMACLLFPFAAFSSNVPTTAASVRGFNTLDTTINAGQSTVIQVTTNASATHVFALVDNNRVAGVPKSEDSAGNLTWEIAVSPSRTQDVAVYVNTANSMDGAVMLTTKITVNGSGSATTINTPTFTPDSTPSANGVIISDIRETRGSTANTAILTVETNAKATDVWVQFDANKYARARLESETSLAKTWSITLRPSRAQLVTVSANTGYFVRGAAIERFEVTLSTRTSGANTSTGTARINSVRSNRTNLSYNESVTLTITTNMDATDVWIDVDNRDINARMTRQSRTTKTWTATFTPDRSQTLTIYANDIDSEEGAATRTHRITVSDRSSSRALIVTASANHYDYYYDYNNNNLPITVETTSAARSVWITVGGTRIANMSSYTTLSNGNRRWTYNLRDSNYYGTDYWSYYNRTIIVHAGVNNNISDDSRTLNINWSGDYNYNNNYGQVYAFSGWGTQGGTLTFTVTTDTAVNQVHISGHNFNRTFHTSSSSVSSYVSGGQRYWTITQGGHGIPVGTYNFTVTASSGSSYYYGSQTATVNIGY